MERIQRIRKRADKLNDRGFSLIELIIVTAIMAVLVGVVGAQIIPYLENTRVGKDEQILSAYVTAGMSAYSFHADSAPNTGEMEVVITPGSSGGSDVYTCSEAQDIADEMKVLMGSNGTAVTAPSDTFYSKIYKRTAKIVLVYDFDHSTITAKVYDASDIQISGANPLSGHL